MERFLFHPQCELAEARAILVSLPFEGTVTYWPGTAGAPREIVLASHQLEYYEEDLGWEPTNDLGICSIEIEWTREETVETYLRKVRGRIEAAPADSFLVGIGGEHTVTIPLAERCLAPGDLVVIIDAHPDLRSRYGGEAYSHASVARRLVEKGLRLVQIGLGCISREESEFVRAGSPVTQFWARDLSTEEGIQAVVRFLDGLSGKAYFSLDADGLCTSIMPGVGTPVPGGLAWHPLLRVVRSLFGNGKLDVRGFDLVEVRPMRDSQVSQFTAAKIIQKVLSHKFGKRPLE